MINFELLENNLKICGKCKETKSVSSFYKNKSKKDGLDNTCKECYSIFKKHSKVTKIYAKLYYNENKKVIRENYKEYYTNNRQEELERCRLRYEKNKEAEHLRSKLYYQSHKDEALIRKNKRRARKHEVNEVFTLRDRRETFDRFSNACFNCGRTEKLSIDHHYPLSKGYPLSRTNAVVLCKRCNASKHTKLPDEFYSLDRLIILEGILNS